MRLAEGASRAKCECMFVCIVFDVNIFAGKSEWTQNYKSGIKVYELHTLSIVREGRCDTTYCHDDIILFTYCHDNACCHSTLGYVIYLICNHDNIRFQNAVNMTQSIIMTFSVIVTICHHDMFCPLPSDKLLSWRRVLLSQTTILTLRCLDTPSSCNHHFRDAHTLASSSVIY